MKIFMGLGGKKSRKVSCFTKDSTQEIKKALDQVIKSGATVVEFLGDREGDSRSKREMATTFILGNPG